MARNSGCNAGRQPHSRRKMFYFISYLFFFRYITDSAPAVFIALLLFILPATKPKFIGWNSSMSDPEQTEEGI